MTCVSFRNWQTSPISCTMGLSQHCSLLILHFWMVFRVVVRPDGGQLSRIDLPGHHPRPGYFCIGIGRGIIYLGLGVVGGLCRASAWRWANFAVFARALGHLVLVLGTVVFSASFVVAVS